MKVTGQQPPRTAELTTGKAREAEHKPDRKADAAKDVSTPSSNRTSLIMSRIREVIRSTPDVRTDRVEAVRAKLQRGEYRVDAERLAQTLLNESLRDDVEKP